MLLVNLLVGSQGDHDGLIGIRPFMARLGYSLRVLNFVREALGVLFGRR